MGNALLWEISTAKNSILKLFTLPINQIFHGRVPKILLYVTKLELEQTKRSSPSPLPFFLGKLHLESEIIKFERENCKIDIYHEYFVKITFKVEK